MITAETLTDADRSAISSGLDRWIAAFNAADVNGLVLDATDDVMAFPPNQPAATGLAALRQWHEDQLRQADATISHVQTEEVIGSATYALHRFSFAIRVQLRAGGAAIDDRGACFWIWRRGADGRWGIARAIWNSSVPLPAAATGDDSHAIGRSR